MMLRMRRWWAAMPLLWAAAGCKDNFTDAQLLPCSTAAGPAVSLAVGQYTVVNGEANSGCVIFPANTTGTDWEYLLVAQEATGAPGAVITYWLQGGLGGGPAPAPPASPPVLSADLSPAERFHLGLRELEAGRWAALPPAPSPGPVAAAPPVLQRAKPVVGELRSFQVLANIYTGRFDRVTARARAVGGGLAIFVDTLAPANGLNTEDLDTLTAVFDDRLYAVDTAAFGRESDINGDEVVIVLMTPVVNRLTTPAECQPGGAGYIVGFFIGADIDPLFANDFQRSNHGEVFYALVPDPAGTQSCPHSRDQVKRVVPVAFVHEFQHMISYNQHVLLRNQAPEVLWLNEALSHYAEELGGRTYLAEGDNAKFIQYVVGNLYNARLFFDTTGKYFTLPRTGIGGLAERGASWLFLRHLIDQYSSGTTIAEWNAFTRALVETPNTGATNVDARIPVPFSQALAQWALANWVDELPGFTAPPELRYPSWDLRNIYQQLNASRPIDFPDVFPLMPPMGPASQVERIGMLRAGTPIYQRAVQPAGAASFTARFGTGYGTVFPASADVRLGIVRIR